MPRIDAHVHYAGEHSDALALLEELDLKLINISVAHGRRGPWREWSDRFRALADRNPDRFAWCASFDLPGFEDPDYVDRMIEGLERDFAAGAVACKVWKHIGMELKDPGGQAFMVDDPLIEPIFAHLEKTGRTLLMHMADPIRFWQTPGGPAAGKHMPSHRDIIAARDRVIARHPKLRVVGAHVGSLSHDLGEVARRFDRYPNFAVDTSARLSFLARQDSETVRAFFIKYSDRILWGTDIVKAFPIDQPAPEREPILRRVREIYRHAFLYYESDAVVPIHEKDFRVPGLGLPEDVLEKFYATNARTWYPGL